MKWNKLLERQIRRLLPDELLAQDCIQRLLVAVNASYESYERDRNLSAHAFSISEQEYSVINDRLKEEVSIRRLGIKNLQEAIRKMEGENDSHFGVDDKDENLMYVISYLQAQVEKQKAMEKEIKESRNRVLETATTFTQLIRNLNEGILVADQQGKIVLANQLFCDLFEITLNPDDLTGIECGSALQISKRLFCQPERFLERMMEIDRQKVCVTGDELEMVSGKILLRDYLPIYMGTEYKGHLCKFKDVTAERERNRELEEARNQAELSSRSKELFLANMSHEIRTPLNAILGMARLLRKTSMSSTQQTYLDTVNTAGEHLLVIINDILDISKIEAGKLQLEDISFQLEELIIRAGNVMRHKAEEKGLLLECSISPDIEKYLVGDPHRLNQVILNLISNAIKFTNSGSITVKCQLAESTAGFNRVDISVRDTGIGMDEGFVNRIFNKFQQEDQTTARKYGGTGLGMSICKQLTEMMGGRITVESQKNQGTEVTVSFPFKIGTEIQQASVELKPASCGTLKGIHILLVEDNEMNRLVATTLLKQYGILVTEAVHGQEAIKFLHDGAYDLVLMDVQMPIMDGLEATRKIRQEMNLDIPIVALTANAIKEENVQCFAAGMDDYVSKPFEEDTLMRVISHFIAKQGKLSAGYDLSDLRKLGQGDDCFVSKMLLLFIKEIPNALQEMNDASVVEDWPSVAAAAHKIRPALVHLQVTALEKEICEIEKAAKNGGKDKSLLSSIQNAKMLADRIVEEIKTKELVHVDCSLEEE